MNDHEDIYDESGLKIGRVRKREDDDMGNLPQPRSEKEESNAAWFMVMVLVVVCVTVYLFSKFGKYLGGFL